MNRQIIHTGKAPAAIGPYSQAVVSSGFFFSAMQIALDPESGELIGKDAARQVRRCLSNVQAVLEEAGGSMDDVVKTTVYLRDLGEFAAVNEEYADFFSDEPPARGVIQVSALPRDAQVAVEIIADLNHSSSQGS